MCFHILMDAYSLFMYSKRINIVFSPFLASGRGAGPSKGEASSRTRDDSGGRELVHYDDADDY